MTLNSLNPSWPNNVQSNQTPISVWKSVDHVLTLPDKTPFAARLIAEAAPDLGATVWLEPEYGFVWEITFANGQRHFFRNTNFNVNPLWSVEIVRDKGYASLFLRRYGYRVAEGKTFFSEKLNSNISIKRDIDDGWDYAEWLGLPVIVKPNNLSQWVWVQKVDTKEEYYDAATSILEKSSVMVIERYHIGQDYRVVVFDNEIISAYTRIPLSVTGDGVSSIEQLLYIKQQQFVESGRDTIIDLADSRIHLKLSKQWMNYASIPDSGNQIFLLDNANLSTGWESIDVTHSIHPDFADLAIRSTRDMWLRLCGVDFMTRDIQLPLAENTDYIIIELNGAPGLDNYMSSGDEQLNNVKSM